MFHFDVVKSLLFFVRRSRIYIYYYGRLILDFTAIYFRCSFVCNVICGCCVLGLGVVGMELLRMVGWSLFGSMNGSLYGDTSGGSR